MHTSSSLFLGRLLYISTTEDKLPDLFPMFFYSAHIVSYYHPRSATIYNADGNEKTEEDDDVKKKHTFSYPLYICGSYTSAAAVIGVLQDLLLFYI
jgi:hypothetical protein